MQQLKALQQLLEGKAPLLSVPHQDTPDSSVVSSESTTASAHDLSSSPSTTTSPVAAEANANANAKLDLAVMQSLSPPAVEEGGDAFTKGSGMVALAFAAHLCRLRDFGWQE